MGVMDRYYDGGRDQEERIPTEKIASSIRTANVPHTCIECGGVIEKGQRYARRVWKIDGEMYVEKRHSYARDCDYDPASL